jgi:hypothetical protein
MGSIKRILSDWPTVPGTAYNLTFKFFSFFFQVSVYLFPVFLLVYCLRLNNTCRKGFLGKLKAPPPSPQTLDKTPPVFRLIFYFKLKLRRECKQLWTVYSRGRHLKCKFPCGYQRSHQRWRHRHFIADDNLPEKNTPVYRSLWGT